MTNEKMIEAIRRGSAEPVDLWLQMKRYIYKIAMKYAATKNLGESGTEELINDLMQESYFAILDALRMYDGSTLFSTYATYWITNRFRRYLSGSVYMPDYVRLRVFRYRRMIAVFSRDFGRMPTDAEIMTAIGYPADQLRREAAMITTASLNKTVSDDEDSETIGDLVMDASVDVEAEVLDAIEQEELRETLWGLVDTLPEAQSQTIRRRYQDGETLQQIGESMGVSYSYVQKKKKKALRKLRSSKISKQLEPFVDDLRYNLGLRSGRGRFSAKRISTTEYAAFKALEYMERLKDEGLL